MTLITDSINSLVSYRLKRRQALTTTACAYLARTSEWGQVCAAPYFARMVLVRVMSAFHLWCYWRWDRRVKE